MLDSKMVVKLWCLPKVEEDELHALFTNVVDAVVDLGIGIEGERDMIVLFPPDMMTYGLGSEVVVEISNIPRSATGEEQARRYDVVASRLGRLIKDHFPKAHVQCSVLMQATIWHSTT